MARRVCRHLIGSTPWSVVNFDKLTYAANLASLASIAGKPRYRFVHGDIADRAAVRKLFDEVRPDAMLNLAAESHVDRSIDSAGDFVHTNITGTFVLLEEARAYCAGLDARAGAPHSVSITSRPTRSSASSGRPANSPRRRPMIHPRPIRQARRRRTIWCALGGAPTAYRC